MKSFLVSCAILLLLLTNFAFAGGGSFTTEKIGIDSGRDLLMTVNIPATIDDSRLTSTSDSFSYESGCIGPDGNPFMQTYTTFRYTMDIYIPELNFWNMNNLRVSVRWINEETQSPSKGYSDYAVEKDTETKMITMSIAYKSCNNGYPDWEQNYYDYDKNAWICGPISEAGCDIEFNMAGDALISLETYDRLKSR